MNGIELQDRESFAAIRECREPNARAALLLAHAAQARTATPRRLCTIQT